MLIIIFRHKDVSENIPNYKNVHKHLNFSFTVSALLKIFVRSRRDWEKKCRIGIRHSPSTNRYGFEKIVHSVCLPTYSIILYTEHNSQ